jgi:protein gp37
LARSSIEWTESTWNPVSGCDKISPGCKHCYAETMAKRLMAMGQPNYRQGFKLALHPAMLERPLAWRTPQMVFVNSMSDLFHKDVPLLFIQRVFDVMRRAEWHTFQVLTKRAERLEELAPSLPWPRNVWMGVSVEREDYTFRIDHLRQTPAAVRFLSLEPLLGPVPGLDLRGIDWVIVGGESGPRARPMEQAWATDIRDQCRRAGIPFFFKQWGGRNKKAAGRLLGGRSWDELPPTLASSAAGQLAARPDSIGRGHRARRGSARPRSPRSQA